jgi:O-antigen/teichoic acid export membrane protein
LKKIIKFLAGSVVMQATGALCGILLARWMSVEDYAYYTVMVMVSGAMVIITKGGVNLGLNSVLGKVWPDRLKSRDALLYALKVRRFIAYISLPFILLSTVWLLSKNNADYITILFLSFLLVLNFLLDFNSRLYDQVVYFDGDGDVLQAWEAVFSIMRLMLIVTLWYLGMMDVVIVVLITYLASGLRCIPIRARLSSMLRNDSPSESYPEIKNIAKKQYPMEVFNVLQAQFVLVLIAFTGDPAYTAAFGAMTRVGQLFLPMTALLNAYMLPKFCKMTSSEADSRFFKWTFWSLVPGLVLVWVSLQFPSSLLWIVGDKYSGYEREIFWVSVFFMLKSSSIFMWQLLANRGRNNLVYYQIPILCIWSLGVYYTYGLASFLGVLVFQLGFPVSMAVVAILEYFRGKYRG